MSDSAPFIRAIIDHPDEDGPRLVYADWLDERGDPRGEFIRLQCELAQHQQQVDWLREIPVESWCGDPEEGDLLVKLDALRIRERELLIAYGPDWYLEFANAVFPEVGCAEWSVEGPPPHGFMVCHGVNCVQREPFRRGFVENFTTTAQHWLGAPCATCDEEKRIRSGTWDCDNCPVCQGHGRILGFAERILKVTPIRRVTLVTFPRVLTFDRGLKIFHFRDRPNRQFEDMIGSDSWSYPDVALRLLRVEYPGIEFRYFETLIERESRIAEVVR